MTKLLTSAEECDMLAYSVKKMVEDIIANGELTRQDVEFLENFIGLEADIDIVVELLSITQALDPKTVDDEFITLLSRCLSKVYAPDGVLTDYSAKALIDLFDPEEPLSTHERRALKKMKNIKHGEIFQNFLDDHCI